MNFIISDSMLIVWLVLFCSMASVDILNSIHGCSFGLDLCGKYMYSLSGFVKTLVRLGRALENVWVYLDVIGLFMFVYWRLMTLWWWRFFECLALCPGLIFGNLKSLGLASIRLAHLVWWSLDSLFDLVEALFDHW
jgi:hypothetical protein